MAMRIHSCESRQWAGHINIQTVPGITAGVAQDTLTAPFNDFATVEELVKKYSGEIAAIIVEPVAGNMGCVLPEKGFSNG